MVSATYYPLSRFRVTIEIRFSPTPTDPAMTRSLLALAALAALGSVASAQDNVPVRLFAEAEDFA